MLASGGADGATALVVEGAALHLEADLKWLDRCEEVLGTMTAVIEARCLRKVHGSGDAEVVALAGVDVALGHGEFLAVTGPSGCGKSTLLNLLGGLDRPTAGEIYLHGERVDGAGEARRARLRRSELGFVFQFFNLIENLTVADNVELPALLAGVPAREARRRAHDLLERLGLAETAARVPGALSGGQQQRVAIARALVNRPSVLLADEPTGNLDSAAAREVVSVLRERSDEGQAIVLVTHDLRVASAAGRVLRMRDGAVVGESDLEGEARRRGRDRPRAAAGGLMLRAAGRLIRADLRQRPFQAALTGLVIAIAAGALLVTLHLRAVMEEPFDDLMRATNGAHVDVMGPPAAVAEAAALPEVAEAGAPRRLVRVAASGGARPARALRAAGAHDRRPPARDRRPAPARAGRAGAQPRARARHGPGPGRPDGARRRAAARSSAWPCSRSPPPTAGSRPSRSRRSRPRRRRRASPPAGTWSSPGCGCATPTPPGRWPSGWPPPARSGVNDWLEARADFTDESRRTLAILGAATLLALLATGFTLATAIGGRVLADRRRIGLLRSVGVTPARRHRACWSATT